MRLAGLGMEAFPNDLAILDNDAANHGIGTRAADRRPRQLDAPPHVEGIVSSLAFDADDTTP